jgi:prolyl oligopeptidase
MRALAGSFCALLLAATPALAEPLRYPPAARQDLVEDHFGVKVADPYRWLEGDPVADPAVRDWVAAENALSRRYLDGLPGRALLKQRMRALFAHGRYTVPRKAGGRYFYGYNSGLQNQTPLYVRDGLDARQRVLIDPNDWTKDGSRALAEWLPSPDGRALAYAVQDAGSDWRTLHVLDVDSGKERAETIPWVKFSQLAWDAPGRGFFYSRFAAPGEDAASKGQMLYYHMLGDDPARDRLIYATPDRPALNHIGQVTSDGRWLVISSAAGIDPHREVHVLSLTDDKAKPRPLVRGFANDWRLIGSRGSLLYFVTDKGAPHLRVVTMDAAHPRARPTLAVPERNETLAGGSLVGNRLVLAYMTDAETVAELVELNGRKVGDVPLPGAGTAAGFGGREGDPETFFSFSGFVTPASIYRFDTASLTLRLFARPDLPFDPDDFGIEQVVYPSKDGTLIPMTIIRKKSLVASAGAPAKPAPTILYGYGGFNISLAPGYSATRMAWLEQGGVYAIAHLRGGGEYGKAWHDAGRLMNKQNVFDDFIAAGEWLKANGYTTPDGLAIEGRSNGGLLVGAVVNQRPDLFAAALPAVGVMDMLRFDRFTAGRYWTDDYGSPEDPADFPLLYGYSPYHNIRPGPNYPAILVTTGDSDDRVVPAHSFKYAAALQAAAIGDKPRLLRVDSRAGHGSGKPVDKIIDEYADSYAFAAKFTGLRIDAAK